MTGWLLGVLLVDLVMIVATLMLSRALVRRRMQQAGRAAQSAAARRESFAEIVATVERLTGEWKASDRIDMIIRTSGQRKGTA